MRNDFQNDTHEQCVQNRVIVAQRELTHRLTVLINGVERKSARPFGPEYKDLTEKQCNKKNAQRLLPASRLRQRPGAGGEPFQREQHQPDNGDKPENTAQNIKESRQRKVHPCDAVQKEALREARKRGINGDYPNGSAGALCAVLFHTAALPVEAPDGSDRQQQEKALRQMRRLDALAREKEKGIVCGEEGGPEDIISLFHCRSSVRRGTCRRGSSSAAQNSAGASCPAYRGSDRI